MQSTRPYHQSTAQRINCRCGNPAARYLRAVQHGLSAKLPEEIVGRLQFVWVRSERVNFSYHSRILPPPNLQPKLATDSVYTTMTIIRRRIFHAYYGDSAAKISIDSLEVTEGRLPRRELALVLEWAVEQ